MQYTYTYICKCTYIHMNIFIIFFTFCEYIICSASGIVHCLIHQKYQTFAQVKVMILDLLVWFMA